MDWDVIEAGRRLGELLTLAAPEGPQTIRRSDVTFVVVPEIDYLERSGRKRTFKKMLMAGPTFDDIVPPRDPSPAREVRW